MQWLIQSTGITQYYLDENASKFLDAVKERNLRWHALGIVPFTHEVTGLDEADPSLPTMLYCSTKMAELASEWTGFRPGVIWDKDWFDPRFCVGKRGDMLNEVQRTITVRELRDRWVDELTFVKPVSIKAFTGMVLETEKEDKDYWLIEHSDLNGDDLLVLSPAVKIEREWRFFVVDGEVVTGSTYRKDGIRIIRHPVSKEAWGAAKRAVKEWMPNDTIVIDIARTESGEYKVVEFNCVNTSGFYSCDVGRLVDALETSRIFCTATN